MDEFEGLSPNVVKYTLILIMDTKDPHFSEVNEVRITVLRLLLHFNKFGVIVEGKAYLMDGSRWLIFVCINNEVLKKRVLFGCITAIFFIDH